jgi:hypothetical protein
MKRKTRKKIPVLIHPHALADAFKHLKTDQIRLAPETRNFVLGRVIATLRAADPKFDFTAFLQGCE